MKLWPATLRVMVAVAVVVCGATRASATLITDIPVGSGPDVVLSSLTFDEGEASLVLTSSGLQLNISHFGDGSYSSTSLTNNSWNLSWLGGAGPDFGAMPLVHGGQGSSSAPWLDGGGLPLDPTGSFVVGSDLSPQPGVLTAVPEPASMTLLGLGAAFVVYRRRRQPGEAEVR